MRARSFAFFAVPFVLVTVALAADGSGLGNIPTKKTPPVVETPTPDGYATVKTAKTTKLRNDGSSVRPATYLGVHLELVDGKGFAITQVDSASPASKAGLKVGDVVKSVNGEVIRNTQRFRYLVQEKLPGDSLTIETVRNGKTNEVKVSLDTVSRPLGEDGQFAKRVLLGIFASPTEAGFRVDSVVPASPADEAGFKPGDIITHVGERTTEGANKIADLLVDRNPGDRIMIKFRRDGEEMEKEVTLIPAGTGKDQPRGWDDRRAQAFRGKTYRLAVIPIEYPDKQLNPKITLKDWDKSLFSEGVYKDKSATGEKVYGSMRDYYLEISCGQLKVEGKVFEPVTVTKDRREYQSSGSKEKLFEEVMALVFERDGDDAVEGFDGLFFMYAGQELGTNRQALYWPHQSNFNYKGKRYQYFINPEGGLKMDSISVISHEFGHLLGMPDLYAKPEVPNFEGIGVWCTMSSGHGGKGRPLHYSAWCKEQLGWLTPTVIDPTVPQRLVLAPIVNSRNECFKVLVTPDGSEYLLLENRAKKGFDSDLPGEGLLIWRVVDGRPVLEESHGVPGSDGPGGFMGSVPYPSPSNNAFTPFTVPSSQSQKRGSRPVHITNIQKLPDGKITFQIGFEYF